MTLKEFIAELSSIKKELQDKPVIVLSKRGHECSPSIRFKMREPLDFTQKTKHNVEAILIDWEC